jgi:hypothetical protein
MEYHQAVTALNEIMDEIGQQKTYPLADLAETLALFIEAYEDAHVLSLNNPFSRKLNPRHNTKGHF